MNTSEQTNQDDTIYLYSFWCKGIAGAPPDEYGMHLTGEEDDAPKPLPDRTQGGLDTAGYSYWALSYSPTDELPPLLIHIYFEGPLPPDEQRDVLNRLTYNTAMQFLFAEEDAELETPVHPPDDLII